MYDINCGLKQAERYSICICQKVLLYVEAAGYLFSDTHVQCLTLCIDLYYIKQAVRCQDNYKNKALVISYDTFNDVMYFAIG